jgi:uncharacterized radical SAM protein YgiQ
MTSTHFLPITKKEVMDLGWEQLDVILISGDAYVDHPSFGTAVIGRTLEKMGLKVAILPQPNWKDDLRDFMKLGKPRLFFGITAGNMDSMVNHYTANKRLRSDDAYTPGGQACFRPDNATIIYTKIIKRIFPDVPVVLGGIEASMRRLSHYDFWINQLRPSILVESGADLLVYGMGEKPVVELAKAFETDHWQDAIKQCSQIEYLSDNITAEEDKFALKLHSFEQELKSKQKYGENFVKFESESNQKRQRTLIQPYKKQFLIVKPPYPTPTEKEMDEWALYDVMKYAPHPKYAKRGPIPAFEMIKNSVTIHRGCFGGCSFCTISAHQGKFISSRSEQSILEEVRYLVNRDYFKGHISDLGGPSANMYQMKGFDETKCAKCMRNTCLYPHICPNLNLDHQPLIDLYQKVSQLSKVKKLTIGSGIRYEMLIRNSSDSIKFGLTKYLKTVINHHISGRLKVAPEHTSPKVTDLMRKPHFDIFIDFLRLFNKFNQECGKKQQLIPYLMSAHPGCGKSEMIELAQIAKKYRLMTDQVQEFTPTPMSYATAMYYLGYDPYTLQPVKVAKDLQERKNLHRYFFD